ncbi:uncharacterized protein LOC143298913 [Babylonia areolata]|uniref:uncharacterized protein LOC143298913 n=1 Tax=Babylonia areolata TaxID=304850 RepID=UPI003FD34CA1
MRVCILSTLLAVAVTISSGADNGAYSSGSGGDYASVKAAQGHQGGSGGGGTFGGAQGHKAGGHGGGPIIVGRSGGGGPHVAGVSTLDSFGSALGAGDGTTAFQRGTAQVHARDRAIAQAQEQANRWSRHYDNADAGASRSDNQGRKGQLKETAFNNQDQQAKGSNSHQSDSYDRNYDRGSETGQKQIDANDKHAGGLQSHGQYNRKDQAANQGNKALSNSKNAFTNENKGLAKVDFAYKKNFDNNFSQIGGFKEAVSNDNTHSDVFEVKQKDNRISKGLLDTFRRSDGNSASKKENDWLSNAAQAQKLNNQYGAADRLKDAAGQKNADFSALFDRRNDVFWHRDTAQDQALREANDLARKEAGQQKSAIAEASGNKGVKDSKYYGGGTFGSGSGSGSGAGSGGHGPVIVGHAGAGSQTGTAADLYRNAASGPRQRRRGGGGAIRRWHGCGQPRAGEGSAGG